MKKSVKPLIVFYLSIFLMFAFLILGYIGFKLECEKLIRENVETEKSLSDIKNLKVNLIAEDQSLSSEERIVNIAQNELGMVKRTGQPVILTVSKAKIEQISSEIQKKYE
ncbi:MAG: hypothetical protein ACYCVH_04240 [Ignavibacteriaceae bacterium]